MRVNSEGDAVSIEVSKVMLAEAYELTELFQCVVVRASQ